MLFPISKQTCFFRTVFLFASSYVQCLFVIETVEFNIFCVWEKSMISTRWNYWLNRKKSSVHSLNTFGIVRYSSEICWKNSETFAWPLDIIRIRFGNLWGLAEATRKEILSGTFFSAINKIIRGCLENRNSYFYLLSHKEKVLFFIFLYREGSVIADFVVNFKTTGDATVLETASGILKDSLNQSRNSSSFGEFLVDPTHAFLVGKM